MDIIGTLKAVVVGLFKAYFWLPNLVMDFCFAHLGSIGVLLGIFAFMFILFVQAYLLGMLWTLLGGKVPAPAGRGKAENDLFEDAVSCSSIFGERLDLFNYSINHEDN